MRLAERARRLEALPWPLLVAAVGVQWLSAATVAAWSRPQEDFGDPVVLLNVALVGPLALLAALVLARTIAGRALAAWTAVVWLAGPWLLVPYALPGYRQETRDLVLPLLLGLTPDRGYAAGLLVLAGAVLATVPGVRAAALAGAALGAAALLVPAALAFGAAALAGLLLTRARDAAAAAAVLVPLALGAALLHGLDLAPRSEDAFKNAMGGLREYFWSQRLAQWAPVAGAIGVARRSPLLALVLGAGFVGFAVVQAARESAVYADASFFRLLLPGLPAFALLVAALPLLVPTLAARLGERAAPVPLSP